MVCWYGSEDDLKRPIRALKARPYIACIGQAWVGAVAEVVGGGGSKEWMLGMPA